MFSFDNSIEKITIFAIIRGISISTLKETNLNDYVAFDLIIKETSLWSKTALVGWRVLCGSFLIG